VYLYYTHTFRYMNKLQYSIERRRKKKKKKINERRVEKSEGKKLAWDFFFFFWWASSFDDGFRPLCGWCSLVLDLTATTSKYIPVLYMQFCMYLTFSHLLSSVDGFKSSSFSSLPPTHLEQCTVQTLT